MLLRFFFFFFSKILFHYAIQGKFSTWLVNSALNCTRKPISHSSLRGSCDIGFRMQFNAEFPRQVMNFSIESSTCASSFLTCARWPPWIFLYFLSTATILVPQSDLEGPFNEFILRSNNNSWREWFRRSLFPKRNEQNHMHTKEKLTLRDCMMNNQRSP